MWKVGIVQEMTDPSIEGLIWGFNVTNESGRPLISFAYERRSRRGREAC
jgi:hypothetical protein